MHHDDTMKKIANPYLGNRECSVQEAKYHILPELMLRRILPILYFVNAKCLEERVQVLLSEKKLIQPPEAAQTYLRNLIFIAV